MNTMKPTITTTVSGLFLLSCFGCMGKGQPNSTEFFPIEETVRVRQFQDVQAANAACEDGTLYPQHFSGGELNSLGQRKLELMLKAEDACPQMIVYISGDSEKDTNLAKDRETAVMAFCKAHGVKEDNLHIESGFNPGSSSFAREGLQRLNRTESGAAGATADSGGGAADTGASLGLPSAGGSSSGSTSGSK